MQIRGRRVRKRKQWSVKGCRRKGDLTFTEEDNTFKEGRCKDHGQKRVKWKCKPLFLAGECIHSFRAFNSF
jgi:hypothetical protein